MESSEGESRWVFIVGRGRWSMVELWRVDEGEWGRIASRRDVEIRRCLIFFIFILIFIICV
jgi:hypothetical protein